MLNKFVYTGALLLSTFSTNVFAFDAIEEFEAAWINPKYTHYEAPAANINELLDKQTLTGTQLWDAEKRKAWDPMKYIPPAVIKGVSYEKSYPRTGEETFMRSSQQRSWLDPKVIVPVLEEVHVFEKLRKVIFLGRPADEPSGQPLFHVEHSVGGTEENPLSLWRIIMLTPDKQYVNSVEKLFTQRSKSLPLFVQKYLEHDVK